MSVTAGNVMDASAALLADPAKITFSYLYQIPFLRIAWEELQIYLVINGLVDVEEVTSAPVVITTGTKEWVSGVPTDLLTPLNLWEKAVGEPDTALVEMDEIRSDPNDSPDSELENWWFEEGRVKFKGATSDRSIVMRYQREIVPIADENTILPVLNVKSFLTFRTAAIIARVRGNKSRADDLDADSELHRENLIGVKVKDEQNTPVRQRRYAYSRRARRSSNLI